MRMHYAQVYIVRTAFIASACISDCCDKCASDECLHFWHTEIRCPIHWRRRHVSAQNAVTRDHTESHAWANFHVKRSIAVKQPHRTQHEQFKNHLDSFFICASVYLRMYDNLLHIIWPLLCAASKESNGKWEGERTQIVIQHLKRLAILG